MAAAGDVREWAKDNGQPASRGKLSAQLIDAWNTAHPDDPYQARPGQMSVQEMDDLFDEPSFTGDGGPAQDTGETKPRPVPKTRPGKAPGGLAGLFPGRAKTGKKKPPRVSTESLLGSAWRAAAKLAAPLPPLQRTLRVQAPVAGILLEDAVKGTLADTVLQPFARLAETGKTVSALVGPPLYVTALSVHVQQRAAAGLEPNPFVMTLGIEGLRSSLMCWMEIAGPKFAEALQREREFEDKYGQQVDAFIAWLMSPPPSTPEEAMMEEAMFARATGQDRDDDGSAGG